MTRLDLSDIRKLRQTIKCQRAGFLHMTALYGELGIPTGNQMAGYNELLQLEAKLCPGGVEVEFEAVGTKET